MPARAALICNLILAASVLLAGAYPKKDVRNVIEVDDELLEDALSETEIPESEEEDLVALRPTGFSLRRRLRRLRERICAAARRIEKGVIRALDHAKPYLPLILNVLFGVPVR
ncbi:hypothetical protein AAHC03_023047 [Spirometra sp. Aus1]